MCIFLSGEEEKKKTMETAILEFLPVKAQPLVRKLDSLLAAVEVPGNVFKHCIVPVVLV